MSFLHSWMTWLGIGVGTTAVAGAAIAIFAPSVLQIISSLLTPIASALGEIIGDRLRRSYAVLAASFSWTFKSGKGLACLACVSAMAFAYGYHLAYPRAERHAIAKLHKHYRFIPKPKPATVVDQVLKPLKNIF